MSIKRLNHAVLYVRDAKRSVAFYTEVLGFRVRMSMGDQAFFLQADELDLGDIGDPQQSLTDTIGIVFQFLITEFSTRQCIDIAEGIAKFIVEGRSDDTGRQPMTSGRNGGSCRRWQDAWQS